MELLVEKKLRLLIARTFSNQVYRVCRMYKIIQKSTKRLYLCCIARQIGNSIIKDPSYSIFCYSRSLARRKEASIFLPGRQYLSEIIITRWTSPVTSFSKIKFSRGREEVRLSRIFDSRFHEQYCPDSRSDAYF